MYQDQSINTKKKGVYLCFLLLFFFVTPTYTEVKFKKHPFYFTTYTLLLTKEALLAGTSHGLYYLSNNKKTSNYEIKDGPLLTNRLIRSIFQYDHSFIFGTQNALITSLFNDVEINNTKTYTTDTIPMMPGKNIKALNAIFDKLLICTYHNGLAVAQYNPKEKI